MVSLFVLELGSGVEARLVGWDRCVPVAASPLLILIGLCQLVRQVLAGGLGMMVRGGLGVRLVRLGLRIFRAFFSGGVVTAA